MTRMPFSAGLPETACGFGSTVAFTEGLRQELPKLFQRLGIRSIIDAPCGDFNWMARTDLSAIKYTGIDYDRDHCLKATRPSVPEHFAPWSKIVLNLDLAVSALPQADLILCRDFLQHLPSDTVRQVLHNFKRSGATYLLTTNHEQWSAPSVDIGQPGDFRPLNLRMPPFAFPPPQHRLPDGEHRTLSLWRMDEIP